MDRPVIVSLAIGVAESVASQDLLDLRVQRADYDRFFWPEFPQSRPITNLRPIDGWVKEGEFWTAELDEIADGYWDFRMLQVNGRMCPRARLPARRWVRPARCHRGAG